MTANRTTLLLVLLIGLFYVLGAHLDEIDDHSDEYAQAVYLQDAINASIQQQKFDRAAQALCGPQAAWAQLQDGSVQCRTKYGKPTITVQVSP